MAPPPAVLGLVERFERNAEAYRSSAYNETQVRREFIDPMFKALGWDMDNEQGYAEAYKDVVHEDAIKIGGAAKAPDYCFRVGGTRKFFLEARKPAVNIRDDLSPAYQLRRYAWSAKLPLSVLTDFEEFAVYDCRVRPDPTDKASTARILCFRYTDYAERWDEIASIFSRDAILKGSFDKYAESTARKRGAQEVDAAFLAEIESWRTALARNIALRNADLSPRELNFAVQATIDRIIFLRICEDRGIENYGRLRALRNGGRVYARLLELFEQAGQRYNSGLFRFHNETGRGQSDALTPRLAIDDKPLEDILGRLYYPDGPYEFSVLGADILGQVYEQFLGKAIRLTPGHRAVVEEKPEVRKAGGVYYTPTYIVDYIVKNTVGRLLEGRTAGPRGTASRLRILDPACGSGSFLLGAFERLLQWHLEQYTKDDPKKWATDRNSALFQNQCGEWRLTTAERKRILLNNIHGVDVDPRAVEVTKLSLLLKVLESESSETLTRPLTRLRKRALPDLASNIKCGNSLIGPDFHKSAQVDMFDPEQAYRINAFDWEKEFPEIISNGGFDAVIGNPPYLFITEVPEDVRGYYQRVYSTISYRFDLYGAFIERSVCLLVKKDGVFGFIIPHTLLSNDSFGLLRSLLANKTHVYHVVDLGAGVFQNARNETMLLFSQNALPLCSSKIDVLRSTPRGFPNAVQQFIALQKEWAPEDGSPWLPHVSPALLHLLSDLDTAAFRLGDLCASNQGLRTGNNETFLSNQSKGGKWKPAAGGKHVGRYCPLKREVFVLYDPSLLDAPRREEIFTSSSKIVVQEIRNISLWRRIVATLDRDQFYCLQSTNVINTKPRCAMDIRYILGVLNSATVNLYFRYRFPGNNHIPSNQLLGIPIPGPSDKTRHDDMVALVERMLALHKQLAAARTGHDQTLLQRQTDAADAQIDRLVYDLYGLTPAEIAIVEGGAS